MRRSTRSGLLRDARAYLKRHKPAQLTRRQRRASTRVAHGIRYSAAPGRTRLRRQQRAKSRRSMRSQGKARETRLKRRGARAELLSIGTNGPGV